MDSLYVSHLLLLGKANAFPRQPGKIKVFWTRIKLNLVITVPMLLRLEHAEHLGVSVLLKDLG